MSKNVISSKERVSRECSHFKWNVVSKMPQDPYKCLLWDVLTLCELHTLPVRENEEPIYCNWLLDRIKRELVRVLRENGQLPQKPTTQENCT